MWEPTKQRRKELMSEFMRALAGRTLRLVEVDARPLDTLVQRSIAQAAMNDFSSKESFDGSPLPAAKEMLLMVLLHVICAPRTSTSRPWAAAAVT